MTDHVEPKDPSEPESASASVASSQPEAESAVSGQIAAEPAVEASESSEADEGDAGDAEPGEAESAEAEGGEHPDGKRKKRRRRRKKKKSEEGGLEAEASAAPPKKKEKDTSHLPFQRFFESANRRHAFAVGEIVAGRVLRVENDAAVVDLFGKAIAYARACEPREIPIAAEPVSAPEPIAREPEAAPKSEEAPPAEAHAQASEAEIAANEAAARELAAAEAADAEHAEPAEAHEGDEEGEEVATALPEDVPEPSYRVRPEGVPELVVGDIGRGRVGAVAESGHIALVNELVDAEATRRFLAHARNARARVHGLVFGFNRGGFDVLICGLRAFCPVGGLSLGPVEHPEALLGEWGEFHVQTAKAGSQGLVVSRRSILEKDARKRARQMMKALQPGQKLRGRVTQVREFGLFVDIGGVEGLVHQSELGWERNMRPADVARPGDEIDVQVLQVHEPQPGKRDRHERISLSMKAFAADPWDAHAEALTEGVPRKGVVVRTAEFGAFVQLAPGIDGLLHITELGKDLKHADQAVSEGTELFVVIERVDRRQRRISLSKLSAEEAQAYEAGKSSGEGEARLVRLKQGEHVKVKVTQVTPAGIQVQIDGVLGRKGRGFLPNAEMGTPRGTDHRRGYPPGTELEVKIIGTDRDGGLRCSRKGFLVDEERKAVRDYRKEAAKQGFGTFGDLLRSKLGEPKAP